MFGNLLLKLLVPLLAAVVAAIPLVWCRERGVDVLVPLLRRFRRLPFPCRLFVALFVACLVVHGSTKNSGTNSPSGSPRRHAGADGDRRLSAEQLAAGFVLRRDVVGQTFDFDPPANAVVQSTWLKRGAHADSFSIAGDADAAWTFPFGTGTVRRVTVSSQGAVLLHYGAVCTDADEGARMRDLWAGPGVRPDTLLLAPLRTRLGILPEARHGLLPAGARPSRFWHAVTDGGGLLLTWQNAALARDAAAPVCVQVELRPDGSFVYRYRLPSVPSALFGEDLAVGAWNAGHGESLATNRAGVTVSALLARTGQDYALEWHPLEPRDGVTEDRDGDGLSTFDELYLHGTDPGCFDTDGDGVGDGAELAAGLDPLRRDSDSDGLVDGSDPEPAAVTALDDEDGDGLPDAYERHWFGGTNALDDAQVRDASGFTPGFRLAAGLNPTNAPSVETVSTNRLVAYKLWDGFAVPGLPAGTNLVYERTLAIGKRNNWQQYYLSSAPDCAGGWALENLVLEWEDSSGASGMCTRSPFADSVLLPLGAGEVGSLTVRLRATGCGPRSGTPVYLLAYAPEVRVAGAHAVDLGEGRRASVYTRGSNSRIELEIDRSGRPCRAALRPSEQILDGLDAMGLGPDGFVYEGDCRGGIVRSNGTGVFELPDSRVAAAGGSASGRSGDAPRAKVYVLCPFVGYVGKSHCPSRGKIEWETDGGLYSEEERYPLDSDCLWRNWWRSSHSGYICTCELSASSGIGEDEHVSVETSGSHAKVYVGGEEVWSGQAVHDPDWTCGGTESGQALLTEAGDCRSCGGSCENGKCDDWESHALSSLGFRIPLGMPAANTLAGFVYIHSDGPVRIAPETFRFLFHPDATNAIETVETATARRVTYRGVRGRDLLIAATNDGVTVTVRTTAGAQLEHVWEITNPEGDENRVRLRKISRQDNVMDDWTYTCSEDAERGWIWTRFDNIARVGERYTCVDRLNDPENRTIEEVRTTSDAEGRTLRRVRTVSALVGECGNAVRREILREEDTGRNVRRRRAEYWRDDDHACRNGRPRLVQGDDVSWRYQDWNEAGLEILRVEQRDGSPVPRDFPHVASNGLAGVTADLDAFVTVFDYGPLPGDTSPLGAATRPRQETRYAVRNGLTVCIGRTWRRCSGLALSGLPCLREETWRAADADAAFGSDGTAYASRTYVEDLGPGVSTVMSGQVVEEVDEDGVRRMRTFASTNGVVVRTTRTYRGEREYPTYTVEELDAAHGTLLRAATCLAEGDVVLADARSVYDEKNRLRSTTYSDGTSLTNAYSCCRLLWASDREGRRRLRSGRTGSDHLYNADEDVWMLDAGTNGYRVTQHFLDAFGRETNTVTYVGSIPGEANEWTASAGRWLTSETVAYPFGGDDFRVARDARGRTTTTWVDVHADREERTESVAVDDDPSMRMDTTTVRVRNGATRTRRTWDDKWTERTLSGDYTSAGRRVVYDVTESSDYGVVTNRVAEYDLLGREVSRWTPLGTTTFAYDGTSSRRTGETLTAPGVARTTEELHDELGRPVGSRADGVAHVEEESYGQIDGAWWRIVRSYEIGTATNAVTERREQLTGLSDACRARTVQTAASGEVTERVRAYDPDTGLETETVSSSVRTPRLRVSLCGLPLEERTAEGTAYYAYDALGRLVREERTVGSDGQRIPVRANTYDALGDCVATCTFTNAVDGAVETYAYDAAGRRVSQTDAAGVVRTRSYDAAGRLVGESGGTYPVCQGYDTEGRRTWLATTRDGETWDVTRWTYDGATGSCVSKTFADGSRERYGHTPDGLPREVVRASGKLSTNIYDAHRRLVGVSVNEGTLDAVFVNDAFGRRTSESGDGARYAYRLAPSGLATNEVATFGTNAFTFVREEDAYGRVVGRGLVGGGRQRIGYTDENRIGTVVSDEAVVTYHYGPDGTESGYTLALSGGAVFTRQTVHDLYRDGHVLAVSNFVGGVLRGGYEYGYDARAQVVRRNADVFGYNARGEVTSATVAGLAESYAYDGIGNRTSSACDGRTVAYAANGVNQYASVARDGAFEAVECTEDGELARRGDWTYSYDRRGRLESVSSNGVELLRNAYDTRGRRIHAEVPGAVHDFVYDGWLPVRETVVRDDGGTSVAEYFWGRDLAGSLTAAGGVGALLYLKVDGAAYVPFYDANGNVVAYCDADGTVVAEYVYDAFGRTVSSTGPQAELFRLRHATKYTDAATGLVDHGRRFYDPVLGRWLTRDPLEEDGGLNLYAFCGNDAVNEIDPLGELNAITAFLHYLGRSATDESVDFAIVDTSGIRAKNFPQVESDLSTCRKGDYLVDDGYVLNTGARSMNVGLMLGNITIQLTGYLNIASNGDWTLHGVLTAAQDTYDFNKGNRPFPYEQLTTIGRNLPGKIYKISIEGDQPIVDSGNCCDK